MMQPHFRHTQIATLLKHKNKNPNIKKLYRFLKNISSFFFTFLIINIQANLPCPVVLSRDGPVDKDGVPPFNLVQSKLSLGGN